MSNDIDHNESHLANTVSRIHREFPLSSHSLSQQVETIASTPARRYHGVRETERLARELSAEHQRQENTRRLIDARQLQYQLEHAQRDILPQPFLSHQTSLQETEDVTSAPDSSFDPHAIENMPARAAVPILPATSYKEQSEKEFERSLEPVLTVNTVNTGSSFEESRIIQQVGQRLGESVQMRGGEATEHYRYSLRAREFEGLHEEQQRVPVQSRQSEAELAPGVRVFRPLHNTGPNAEAVQEVARHFEYSPYHFVSPGDVMSAVDARRDMWLWTEAGMPPWPETSRPWSRYHTLLSSPVRGSGSRRRRNSV
ncbi:hypothetical protein SVAN01_00798 [Stagonosporopsis vannaccii]|nr:hypothetical protein SVAN01_00798 [Stagonosporopsis vannaccii]